MLWTEKWFEPHSILLCSAFLFIPHYLILQAMIGTAVNVINKKIVYVPFQVLLLFRFIWLLGLVWFFACLFSSCCCCFNLMLISFLTPQALYLSHFPSSIFRNEVPTCQQGYQPSPQEGVGVWECAETLERGHNHSSLHLVGSILSNGCVTLYVVIFRSPET